MALAHGRDEAWIDDAPLDVLNECAEVWVLGNPRLAFERWMGEMGPPPPPVTPVVLVEPADDG